MWRDTLSLSLSLGVGGCDPEMTNFHQFAHKHCSGNALIGQFWGKALWVCLKSKILTFSILLPCIDDSGRLHLQFPKNSLIYLFYSLVDISMMWLLIIDRGVCCTNWDYWRGKENQWCTRQRMYHVRDGYPSSETHNGEKSNKRNRCNYAVMHSSEDIWQRWITFNLTLLQRKKKIYVAKRNVKGSCDMDDTNRNSVICYVNDMIWQCGGDICTAGYLWH